MGGLLKTTGEEGREGGRNCADVAASFSALKSFFFPLPPSVGPVCQEGRNKKEGFFSFEERVARISLVVCPSLPPI